MERFGASSDCGAGKKRARLRTLTQCALMAALLCLLAPWSIPLGAIPVSFGLFAVLLAGVLLGPWRGAISVLVYLLIGGIGLPVFSGAVGGFGALIGPTGGYLWAYPLAAILAGIFARAVFRRGCSVWRALLLTLFLSVSVLVCYLMGVIQLACVTEVSIGGAILSGAVPFLPFDLFKCLAVAFLAAGIQKRAPVKR